MPFAKSNKVPFANQLLSLWNALINVLKINRRGGLNRGFTVYCQVNPDLSSIGTFDFKMYYPIMPKNSVASLLI